jgi:Tfp pilus assembly protein PilN
MKEGTLNLLPPMYGARARMRLVNRRIIMAGLGITILTVGLIFQARMSRASSESRLVLAQAQAEKVLIAEQLEARLVDELEMSRRRIESWRKIALPIPVGSLLVTMANVVPESIVLDELHIDLTGIRQGYRRDNTVDRRLIARIEGFAPDEQTVRRLVETLRKRHPFEEVRRGFTALHEEGELIRTKFSLGFEIDMETPSFVVTGEER